VNVRQQAASDARRLMAIARDYFRENPGERMPHDHAYGNVLLEIVADNARAACLIDALVGTLGGVLDVFADVRGYNRDELLNEFLLRLGE
jgi:hypothetical protein